METDRKKGNRLLRDREVADIFKMSLVWVRGQRHLRKKGEPHFLNIDSIKIGERSVRYWETDVLALRDSLQPANDNNAANAGDQAPEVDGSAWDVYVDGSCIPNPGPGGYACVVYHTGKETELVGGEAHTTNNRMELMAPIVALETLPARSRITVYSDSTYVIHGITNWIHIWKANGWKNSKRKPVDNQDLWERLDKARQKHDVRWLWIPGHDNVPGHDRADALARAEAERRAKTSGPIGRGFAR